MNNNYLDFLVILKDRFLNNMHRHPNTKWEEVESILSNNTDFLRILYLMEETDGSPDVVEINEKESIIFVDCSKETPIKRRSVCYDQDALDSRKKFKPDNNAVSLAKEIGSTLLTLEEYKRLQEFEMFDLKSSSWLLTPSKIRKLGGAIFGENKYEEVFIFANGADSYYSTRGFRTKLLIK